MKSEYSEKNAISEIFDKCISHPTISFKLYMDGKVKMKITPGIIPRMQHMKLYGKKHTELVKLSTSTIGKIKVDAYLVDPKFVRSKRSDINIFINQRYIKNYVISQSIIDGYQTFLMTNKSIVLL